MTLILSILRSPEGVASETRVLTDGTLSIGRSASCDWVLPDPERVLSKRHCFVSFEDNAWHVTDTSANGTFLNDEVDRMAAEEKRALRNGDRLHFGSYEIEAAIEPASNGMRKPPPLHAPEPKPAAERLTSDPFPPLDDDFLGIALPSDEEPFDFGRTTPDHVSAMSASFRPPRPTVEVLPEDWDLDPADAQRQSRETLAPKPPAREEPAPEPPAVEKLPPAPTREVPLAVIPAAAPPPQPAPPRPAAAAAAEVQGAAEAFIAFAKGAGIDATAPADPAAALHGLGAAFRAFVAGLRRVMMARAAIKGTFRIDQTMIQAFGNNPLKFSADDEDAMAALLGVGRRVDMSAERAVSEAMRDIWLHELAMTNAMREAAQELLAKLDPARITDKNLPADMFEFVPWRRAARQWDLYVTLHRSMAEALGEDFDSVFGRSFMRAYERAMKEIAAAHRDD